MISNQAITPSVSNLNSTIEATCMTTRGTAAQATPSTLVNASGKLGVVLASATGFESLDVVEVSGILNLPTTRSKITISGTTLICSDINYSNSYQITGSSLVTRINANLVVEVNVYVSAVCIATLLHAPVAGEVTADITNVINSYQTGGVQNLTFYVQFRESYDDVNGLQMYGSVASTTTARQLRSRKSIVHGEVLNDAKFNIAKVGVPCYFSVIADRACKIERRVTTSGGTSVTSTTYNITAAYILTEYYQPVTGVTKVTYQLTTTGGTPKSELVTPVSELVTFLVDAPSCSVPITWVGYGGARETVFGVEAQRVTKTEGETLETTTALRNLRKGWQEKTYEVTLLDARQLVQLPLASSVEVDGQEMIVTNTEVNYSKDIVTATITVRAKSYTACG